jgi:hypothetical protein
MSMEDPRLLLCGGGDDGDCDTTAYRALAPPFDDDCRREATAPLIMCGTSLKISSTDTSDIELCKKSSLPGYR